MRNTSLPEPWSSCKRFKQMATGDLFDWHPTRIGACRNRLNEHGFGDLCHILDRNFKLTHSEQCTVWLAVTIGSTLFKGMQIFRLMSNSRQPVCNVHQHVTHEYLPNMNSSWMYSLESYLVGYCGGWMEIIAAVQGDPKKRTPNLSCVCRVRCLSLQLTLY